MSQRKVIILLLLVLLGSISLIFINFYTIRTTSAVRAYINGESEYSKGQKDALLYLITYLQTEDEQYWNAYQESLNVPIGDNIARRALLNNGSTAEIEKGFLMGKNNPADFDKMIWLFRNFKSVSFMDEAIQIWAGAEPLINQLAAIGLEINQKIKTRTLTDQRKQELIKIINTITAELTVQERSFSRVLGTAGRSIDQYLFFANIFLTVVIVGSLIGYVNSIIKKLVKSEEELKEKNIELVSINSDLDTFVYCTSHDLRSPIMSLRGLVQIVLHEKDAVQVEKYMHLMNTVIDKMNFFITEILDFSKNKRAAGNVEALSLKNIIEESIGQNEYLPEAGNINIEKEINVDTIYSDALRVKIIINNLITNAIKYSDDKKSKKEIKIKTSETGNHCIIEIEDNGIGILKEHHDRIFDMFFVIQNNNKGTGLGLYITNETVKKLNGSIKVKSEKTIGTSFLVKIPNQNGKQIKVSDN